MNQLLYGIIYLVSKLPFKILYFLSDIFFFLGYKIFKYRANIVRDNLKNSFPEKSDKEIKDIEEKFFKNFYDFLIETLKGFSITKKESQNAITFINLELFKKSYQEKKNLILLAGHNFNWEFANVAYDVIPQEHYNAIYRQLQNKFWDHKIIKSREQFGATLINAKNVLKHIHETENDGNSVYAFLADQSPFKTSIKFGIQFLNQKTPVFTGYNRISKKNEMMYVYAEMKKVKRGKFQLEFIEILPEHKQFEEDELIIKYNKLLEKTIKENPTNWLWTHKKWKYANRLTDDMMYKGKDYKL